MDFTKHFTNSDIECNCGCGQKIIKPELIHRVEIARGFAGIPFHVISWNRCLKHNQTVGGVAGSAHIAGWAIDLKTSSGHNKIFILFCLTMAGFTRFGIGKNYIHCDCMPEKLAPRMWWY